MLLLAPKTSFLTAGEPSVAPSKHRSKALSPRFAGEPQQHGPGQHSTADSTPCTSRIWRDRVAAVSREISQEKRTVAVPVHTKYPFTSKDSPAILNATLITKPGFHETSCLSFCISTDANQRLLDIVAVAKFG
ncbi:Mycolic acid-containing lipids exporter MmpL11 [Frankliniella fusca]|uniref:Mycolic acid-containing lipids exporter MmpL11 n=1 Tax=Frankliniella fusca TaxID=407009 RepID=A0AAE1H0Y0_9NEOP|nr:Mycolic acid-containing lipids exporter MmpL11 [Frankliniella fusca]